MLLKFHRVHTGPSGGEAINPVWLNTNHIAKLEPCSIPGDQGKAYITLKDEYAWRDIRVTESCEEIARLINKEINNGDFEE